MFIITAAIKYYTSMYGKDKTPLSYGHPPCQGGQTRDNRGVYFTIR